MEHIGLLGSLFLRSSKYKRREWILLDFSIKTRSEGKKELYVDGKLVASGTQEEILSIMRLMTQHEALEKSSNDEGRETEKYKSNC